MSNVERTQLVLQDSNPLCDSYEGFVALGVIRWRDIRQFVTHTLEWIRLFNYRTPTSEVLKIERLVGSESYIQIIPPVRVGSQA